MCVEFDIARVKLGEAVALLATSSISHMMIWLLCALIGMGAMIRAMGGRARSDGKQSVGGFAVFSTLIAFAVLAAVMLAGTGRRNQHSALTIPVPPIGAAVSTVTEGAKATADEAKAVVRNTIDVLRPSVASPVGRDSLAARRTALSALSVGVFLYLVYLMLDGAARGSFVRPSLVFVAACFVGLCIAMTRLPCIE